MSTKKYYKQNPGDQIWWLDMPDNEGKWVFSFDRQTDYNMFQDYPWALTPEQKEIFDRENPLWADFFSDRSVEHGTGKTGDQD